MVILYTLLISSFTLCNVASAKDYNDNTASYKADNPMVTQNATHNTNVARSFAQKVVEDFNNNQIIQSDAEFNNSFKNNWSIAHSVYLVKKANANLQNVGYQFEADSNGAIFIVQNNQKHLIEMNHEGYGLYAYAYSAFMKKVYGENKTHYDKHHEKVGKFVRKQVDALFKQINAAVETKKPIITQEPTVVVRKNRLHTTETKPKNAAFVDVVTSSPSTIIEEEQGPRKDMTHIFGIMNGYASADIWSDRVYFPKDALLKKHGIELGIKFADMDAVDARLNAIKPKNDLLEKHGMASGIAIADMDAVDAKLSAIKQKEEIRLKAIEQAKEIPSRF